jgi:hypothetical protein
MKVCGREKEYKESSEASAYINTLTPGTYPKEKKLEIRSFLGILDPEDRDRTLLQNAGNYLPI